MGRSRAERGRYAGSREEVREQPSTAGAKLAEQITLLFLSGQAASVTSLAPLLLSAIPGALFRLPNGTTLAADVARKSARLALSTPTGIPSSLPSAGILRAAILDAALHRAHYAINAARRLSSAVMGVEGNSVREALTAAVTRERRYFAGHVEANRRRMAAARATEAMVEMHGFLLSWRHGETRTPLEPRPHHLAAHERNFDLRRGIPVSTGSLPGVEPWCSCAWGPPVPGAPMMI